MIGPPQPRVCTDEPERARNHANAILPREWDGTPFRVDLFDHFPEVEGVADYPASQLEVIRQLADRIEEQIGHPIIEAGSVVPVPKNLPEGWNTHSIYGPKNCKEWREPGQILGMHVADLPEWHAGGALCRRQRGARW